MKERNRKVSLTKKRKPYKTSNLRIDQKKQMDAQVRMRQSDKRDDKNTIR